MDDLSLKPGHVLRFGLYFLAKQLQISNPEYVMGFNQEMRAKEIKIYDELIEKMINKANSPKTKIAEELEDICIACPEKRNCENEESKIHARTIAKIIKVKIGKKYSPKDLLGILTLFHEVALREYQKI